MLVRRRLFVKCGQSRAHRRWARLCLYASLGQSLIAFAQLDVSPRFDTYSDWGGVGLMQMPTARFGSEGEFALSTGRVSPYQRNALTMQPLSWLEGVIRYTDVGDRRYGPQSFSGDQTYKDKGIDVKLKLLDESESWPALALGFRDIGGTGLFAAEYFVASRRYYNLDFSLGVGWGYLGTRGVIANPFGSLSSSFNYRQLGSSAVVNAGKANTQFFHGEKVSLFGGVSYQTPWDGLVLKAEYDGNNYRYDPTGKPVQVDSPVNVAATYAYKDWLDISIGYERGNTLMTQLVFHGNLHTGKSMPKLDSAPVPVKPRSFSDFVSDKQQRGFNSVERSNAIADSLAKEGIQVDSVAFKDQTAIVMASQDRYRNSAQAIGRTARVVANLSPQETEQITYVNLESGMETSRVSIMRADIEKAANYQGSPEEVAAHMDVSGPLPGAEDASAETGRYPSINWFWSPAMKHQIGGPDGSYFYQLYLRAGGEMQLTRHLSFTGVVGANISNNFSALKLQSDSVLPHVRSDIVHYLKEGKTGISELHADYLTNLGKSWYGRASAGIFEEMFGGVGSELLYKPYGQRWAIGADINRVRQRGFDERLDFRDYGVTTGHLDFYYRLPVDNLTAQVSIGKYLAGDKGATFALSREFDSGVILSGFVTKTNVSAAQFGEGSFDKGFSLSIPLDMLSLYSSRQRLGMGWRPLTRDGGQRLNMPNRLYPIVSESSKEQLLKSWHGLLD